VNDAAEACTIKSNNHHNMQPQSV